MRAALAQHINEYLNKKAWFWYAPLLVLGVYIFVSILQFHPNEPGALIIMPATALDFGLHEFAHIATAFLPALITASAGSGSELLLGTLLIYGAFKTKCYFAAMFCCLWFMLACQSVGIYMADARAQNLDLVSAGAALSGSEMAIHDWNFIFGNLHLLAFDTFIGGAVRVLGVLVGVAGIGFAVWLVVQMAQHKGVEAPAFDIFTGREKIHAAAAENARRIVENLDKIDTQPLQNLYPTPTHNGLVSPGPTDKDSKKDV